jgi:outer membrane protein assembly factor BamB
VRTFTLPAGRAGRLIQAGRPLPARRTAAALASVAAVLAASACGTSQAATSTAAPAKAVVPAAAVPASPSSSRTDAASCPTAAWAYEVASTGKVVWKVSLPLASSDGVSDGLQPLLSDSGSEAVLAEGHSLVALRLSDGRRLWRHVFPQAKNSLTGQLTFLYGFHGEVIALVGQVSTGSRLVALSQKTGAVIWTLPLGRYAVIGSPVVTVDSVLAFLTPHGRLEAVSLWTGKLLWSRGYGLATGQPALAAVGTQVIAAKTSGPAATTSSITAFASQTGKPLWKRTGMPEQPTLLATLGGVLVYDVDQNVYPQPKLFPVTELSPATGKTLWRIPTASPVSGVWSSPQTPAIAIATAGRGPRLIMADPVQHRVRWSVATSAGLGLGAAPLLWFGEVLYVTATGSSATLVDREASSGKVRWSRSVPSALPQYLAATGNGTWLLSYGQAKVPGKAGALVIGQTGKVVAKITLPAPAQAPPAVTAGHDTLLQLDTLTCAISYAAAAVGQAS